ncbi:MAG: glycosyltransferase [Ferruginibacter sp.]
MKEDLISQGLFSVIIPVYNAEGFIRECLNSLLNQDFYQLGTVMVDDCSKTGH